MGQFRYIDHTGELGIEAWGDSLAEAFAAAAEAMFGAIADLETVDEREDIDVEAQAPDVEALLVEWLNELLFRAEVAELLLKRFDILELDDRHLKALCFGEKIDQERHRMGGGVKAATYHLAQVQRQRPCRVQVILDV